MKILVRAPNWIGDQVLAFPFFYFLRKGYPKAKISVACVRWVEDLQFQNCIDEIILLEKPISDHWKDKWKALSASVEKIKKQGPFDFGITLPNSFGSALLLWRAEVKVRRGYKTEGRSILLNDGERWDSNSKIHRAQAYVDLLPKRVRPDVSIRDFWGILPNSDLEDGIPGSQVRFDPYLNWKLSGTINPRVAPLNEPYWVLAPGATAESRRWPTSRFLSLARLIKDKTGMKGVIVGGPKEASLAVELTEDRELGLIDYSAQCTVPELFPLFANAKFTVSNESGLAHVAALCGSMVQIVCGAADPLRTRPLGPGRVQVAVNPISCWPCERNVCLNEPAQKFSCLLGITPETVWEEIERGLKLPAKI